MTTPELRPMITDDLPPAGTPCHVCKSAGHWCPARVWCAGDGLLAVCDACSRGEECDVMRLRAHRAPANGGAVDPFAVPRVSPEERRKNRTALIAHLLLEKKLTVKQICYDEGFTSEEVRAVRDAIPELRLAAAHPRHRGGTTKPDACVKALELLKRGRPPGTVCRLVGLTYKTVQKVREENAALVAANCECGLPYGHFGRCQRLGHGFVVARQEPRLLPAPPPEEPIKEGCTALRSRQELAPKYDRLALTGPSTLGASVVPSAAALDKARADLRAIRAALDYLTARERALGEAVRALEALGTVEETE